MAEHIERESILKRFSSYIEDFGYGDRQNKKLSQISIEDAMMIIEDEPAADVRPERHGRWIRQEGSENFIPFIYHPPERWKCSLCDCGVNDDRFCYCPECGAKMDGKDV